MLAQLACDVRVLPRRSRARVFHPVPNVDSVLVGLRRRGPAPAAGAARARPRTRFAHRRKALAALARARARARPPDVRDRARAALVALGHPADARAERLSPAEFRALLGGAAVTPRSTSAAPAKVNLCLFVGPRRARTAATRS